MNRATKKVGIVFNTHVKKDPAKDKRKRIYCYSVEKSYSTIASA